MKKILLLALLFTLPLSAKSYLSEYRGHGYILIFHGDIKDGDEDEVRALQTLYIESYGDPIFRNRAHNYEVQLKQYNVSISVTHDNPFNYSEEAEPYFKPS